MRCVLRWELWLLLTACLSASVVCREVCMTCYADSGPCTIPPGYNVNCIYISIVAGPSSECWTWASDVYGDFDLQSFVTLNNLTVYAMGNYNKPVMTYATELEACRDHVNSLNGTTGWPLLGNMLNIDWEPCSGSPVWPDTPFRLDMGGSVKCTSNLPAWSTQMDMVYDGA